MHFDTGLVVHSNLIAVPRGGCSQEEIKRATPRRAGPMRPSRVRVPSGKMWTQSPLPSTSSAFLMPICAMPAPLSNGSTCTNLKSRCHEFKYRFYLSQHLYPDGHRDMDLSCGGRHAMQCMQNRKLSGLMFGCMACMPYMPCSGRSIRVHV